MVLGLQDSQELVFFINRKDSKVVATSSLARKIIEVDSQIATDLGKKIDEWREKKVASFNSWEAVGISLKKEGWQLNAIREKPRKRDRNRKNGTWPGPKAKKNLPRNQKSNRCCGSWSTWRLLNSSITRATSRNTAWTGLPWRSPSGSNRLTKKKRKSSSWWGQRMPKSSRWWSKTGIYPTFSG